MKEKNIDLKKMPSQSKKITSKISDMMKKKEGGDGVKKGVDLISMVKGLAKRQLDAEKGDSEDDGDNNTK